ncbi:MAG: site-2 protease family protein [Chloroflexota bacterium]
MKSSFKLARIAGIDIGIHYTWLLAFFLFAWLLGQGISQSHPGWGQTTFWTIGIIAALLLFLSVLVHEMAHSLVAKARGMSVDSITLFIFGGVSNISSEAEKPKTEFLMAVVGPLTSLVLGLVLWAVAGLASGTSVSFSELFTGSKFTTPAQALIGYLAYINMALAAFNLLPGFPLDGGRVLRSILWGATGNMVKATNAAATVGQALAWVLIAFGVYQMLGGNFLPGLWMAFIGWFLNSAASANRREVTLQEHFHGVRVRAVMDTNPDTVTPDTTIQDLVKNVFLQRGHRAAPVHENDRLVGMITISDIKALPQQKWEETPVSAIMTRQPIYSVNIDDDLGSAFRLLAQHSLNQIPVLDEGRLVGLLSRADVIRYLQLSQELGLSSK